MNEQPMPNEPCAHEQIEALNGLCFGPDGLSDPPGWSLRTLSGKPFDPTRITTRTEFDIFKGTQKIGSAYLEPNSEPGLN